MISGLVKILNATGVFEKTPAPAPTEHPGSVVQRCDRQRRAPAEFGADSAAGGGDSVSAGSARLGQFRHSPIGHHLRLSGRYLTACNGTPNRYRTAARSVISQADLAAWLWMRPIFICLMTFSDFGSTIS